jgi:hypothetical protein
MKLIGRALNLSNAESGSKADFTTFSAIKTVTVLFALETMGY